MPDQQKGNAGKGGGSEGGQPKGWRSQREAEGAENSGFDRALQPDILSEGVTCLIGLVGQSVREGYRVLFLSLDMNSRVEIRDEDIVYSEKLSPEGSPFGSLGGTRICVKKGATLDYSRTTARKVQAEALAGDEFDLDIQLGPRGISGGGGQEGLVPITETRPRTVCETCRVTACDSCAVTCAGNTCPQTQCGPTCAGNTCPRTQCGPTCATCPRTQCGPTCATCPRTQCETCPRTQCDTCRTCYDTCRVTDCLTCIQNTLCNTCVDTMCGGVTGCNCV
ncbi:MAG TPA: hypothetical protein VEX13_17065 [Chloroflexia bacterium]|nr:hypothetical protein [Chloroflexia bacterium]